MASQQPSQEKLDEISLKDLILKIKELAKFFLRKKWYIIIAFLIGGALGLFYAINKKPIYTATTTFVLENNERAGGLGAYAGLATMVGIDMGGSGGGIFQGDNIIDLYKSKTMIRKTLFNPIDSLSKKNLIDEYIAVNLLRESWENKEQLKNLDFSTAQGKQKIRVDPKLQRLKDSVVSRIVDDIEKNYLSVAKPDKKLSKIQIDVKSKSEIFSKRFNEELVKNVSEFYIQTKTQKALQNVMILQHKTDSVRAVMNGEIYRAVEVVDATPNLNPTRQVQRAAPAQRAQFSAETNKVILAELVKNLEMSKITLDRETPLIQVVDEPIYPLKKEKLSLIKGAFIGGVLFSFLIAFLLLFKLTIKNILSE